jgi:hypothetical protein
VWIKQGAFDRRYLGTFLPDSATTFSHAANPVSAAKAVCGIWNQNNRVLGAFNWTPTFDSWVIPSANTWQQINAQASATVQYVQGQSLDAVAVEHIGAASGTSGGSLGIGLDSTTVPSGYNDHAANTGIGALRARLNKLIPAGAHNLNALAYGNATSETFYGAHTPMQGGLTAELWY